MGRGNKLHVQVQMSTSNIISNSTEKIQFFLNIRLDLEGLDI